MEPKQHPSEPVDHSYLIVFGAVAGGLIAGYLSGVKYPYVISGVIVGGVIGVAAYLATRFENGSASQRQTAPPEPETSRPFSHRASPAKEIADWVIRALLIASLSVFLYDRWQAGVAVTKVEQELKRLQEKAGPSR